MLWGVDDLSWACQSVYQRVRSADNARLLRIQPAAAEQKALQEDSRPGSKELSGAWSLDHASGRPPPLFPSRRELHCAATVPRLGHVRAAPTPLIQDSRSDGLSGIVARILGC